MKYKKYSKWTRTARDIKYSVFRHGRIRHLHCTRYPGTVPPSCRGGGFSVHHDPMHSHFQTALLPLPHPQHVTAHLIGMLEHACGGLSLCFHQARVARSPSHNEQSRNIVDLSAFGRREESVAHLQHTLVLVRYYSLSTIRIMICRRRQVGSDGSSRQRVPEVCSALRLRPTRSKRRRVIPRRFGRPPANLLVGITFYRSFSPLSRSF